MCSDAVQRTQIYLSDEETSLLERESRLTGASRSELIRRAIRAQYGSPGTEARLEALRRGAGVWKDRDFTGADYVDALRSRSTGRRRRLGLE